MTTGLTSETRYPTTEPRMGAVGSVTSRGNTLARFALVLMVVACLGMPHAGAQSLEPAALNLLTDPGENAPGRFQIHGAGTSGEAIGLFTPTGQPPSSLVALSPSGVREVFAFRTALVDDTGAALGEITSLANAQMLSDGSVVAAVTLGCCDRRLLRFVADQVQGLPIAEPLDELAGFARATGSQSRRFWLQRNLGDFFGALDNDLRLIFTDGFTAIADAVIPQFRRLPNPGGFDIDVTAGVVGAGEAGVLVQESSRELFFGDPVIDGNNLVIRDTNRLYVVGSGPERSLLTEQVTFFPNLDAAGVDLEAIGINDRGQVLVQRIDFGARSPNSQRTVSFLRIDPDGTQHTIFNDATAAAQGVIQLQGILANGVAVATAGPAGSRRILLGIPGETRVLLGPGNQLGELTVARVLADVNGLPRVAGNSVAIPFVATAGTSPVYVAMARIDDSREFNWTADFGGEWGDSANWNPGGVPGFGDDTLFATEATYDVVVGSREGRNSRIERGRVTLREAALALEGSLAVGGNAELTLSDGVIGARDITLGHVSRTDDAGTEVSRLTVSGTPGGIGGLSSSASLVVGAVVAGELNIVDKVANSEEVLIGLNARGEARIDGSQSVWTMGNLGVGGAAGGHLRIGSNSSVRSEQAVIGQSVEAGTALGQVTLLQEGPLATARIHWSNTGLLTVGANSPGRIAILDGAEMRTNELAQMGTAAHPNATVRAGTITVAGVRDTGQPSDLGILESLLMGMASGADTRLEVSDGGNATVVERLAIGFEAGSIGSVLVHGVHSGGERSQMFVASPDRADFTTLVGVSGAGTLSVVAGANFETAGLRIGGNPGSSGRVTVGQAAGGFDATLRARIMCVGSQRASQLGCGSVDPEVDTVPGLLQIAAGGRVEVSRAYIVGPQGRIAGSGTLVLGPGNLGGLVEGEIAPGIVVPPADASPESGAGPQGTELQIAHTFHSLHRALPGVLRLGGPLTFADGATLLIDVDGPDATAQDRLIVEGELTIQSGARLVLDFSGGTGLSRGDALLFLEATAIIGSFSEVAVLGLQPGFEFELQPGESGLVLLALTDAVPLGGDDGGDNGGPPPGVVVFEVGVNQSVRCEAVSCRATRREDGQPDPGADLVVESLALEVNGAGAVRRAEITALVHAGEDASPPAAQHFLAGFDADGALLFETSALIELPGTRTRILRDAEGLPVVITEGQSEAGLAYSVEARADGRALHEVRDAEGGLVARITSRVAGAEAAVDGDGTLRVRVAAGVETRAVAEMRPDGVLITRFERFDDGQWLLLKRTLDVINDFAPGSEVLIENGGDGMRFVIDSRVADALVF